ncbi:MAG: YncE family protein [Ignavibacteria bacterium]|jgi:YVTN family beta-propeller protein|nr:YncE family protein [Ignavibacteria bacterium]
MYKSKFIFASIIISFIIFMSFIAGCKNDTVLPTSPSSNEVTYNAVYVVNGGSNSISVIDISTDSLRQTISLPSVNWPHHINMNNTKTKIALGVPGMDLSVGHGGHNMIMDGKVLVLDAITGAVLNSRVTRNMNHNSIFSPDGTEIWTAIADSIGVIFVYNSSTLAFKDSIIVGMHPSEVTFSSDGSMAFVANTGSSTVTVINPLNKSVMSTIPVGEDPVGAWTGSNNKMFVDNEMSQTVSVIDVASMNVEETISLGFKPGYVAYNGALNEVWVTNETDGTAVYFQRMGGVWMNHGNISTGSGAHAIVFSNDGAKAYITNQTAGTVSVINTSSKIKVKDINVGVKPNGLLIRYN